MRTSSVRSTRRRGWWAILGVVIAGLMIGQVPAHAGDRIAELSAQLDAKKSEKERIAAVTALGRLNDKKALKPLVAAMKDKSATVRAVAALALGKLGHKAALPALRDASNDGDPLVSKRAKEAVVLINEANGTTEEPAAEDADKAKKGDGKAGFGKSPKALAARPEVYVVVKSSSDDSSAKLDKKTRKLHAEIAKTEMASELKMTATVTSVAKDAKRYGLDATNIDVIITKLDAKTAGNYVSVEASLRLAISDDRGKMLSFLTGGAKVEVKKASYEKSQLPGLRREAIENAVRGLFDKLIAHLLRGASS